MKKGPREGPIIAYDQQSLLDNGAAKSAKALINASD
jgi:hypothetical protein